MRKPSQRHKSRRLLPCWRGLLVLSLLLVLLSSELWIGVDAAVTKKKKRSKNNHHQFESDNYYTILGLKTTAKEKEIKSAYRKLALQYHPDKIKEDQDKEQAETIFVKVSEAYSILSDKKKREIYDKYGKNGLEAHERGQDPASAGFGFGTSGGGGQSRRAQGFSGFGGFPGGGGGGGSGFGNQEFRFNFNSGGSSNSGGGGNFGGAFHNFGGGGGGRTRRDFDPFSLFNEMFGAGGSGSTNRAKRNQRPQQPQEQQLFPKGQSQVARLGRPKFPDKTSKHMWLVLFYTNADPNSKRAGQKLEKLAAQTSLPYKVGAVDCLLKDQKRFCDEKGMTSIPSFGMVVDGKVIQYKDYDPERASTYFPKALHDFCMEHMPRKYVHTINSVQHMEKHLFVKHNNNNNKNKKQKNAMPSVLLLTDKYETSSMFYSLVYSHRKDFVFGESRAKNEKLAKVLGTKSYPTLIAFFPKSSSSSSTSTSKSKERYNADYDMVRYTGTIEKGRISSWLAKVKADASSSTDGGRTTRRHTEFWKDKIT